MESKNVTGIGYSIKGIFKTLTFWLVLINIVVFIAILINPIFVIKVDKTCSKLVYNI